MSVKSLSKNTAIYSIGTLALRFTAFLLIPLYTHYLSKSEFGLLQILLFTVQIIIAVNDLGMRSALMRFFDEYNKLGKLKELLGSSFSINIIIGCLFLILAFTIPDNFIAILFDVEEIPNLLFFTVLVGIAQTLSLNILSYFRAQDNGIIYMIISVSTALVMILITYIMLVLLDFGILGVLWAQASAYFSMWLLVLIYIRFKHGLGFDLNIFTELFKFGYPLVFVLSGDLIINTSGNYLLGYFGSLEDVAIFSLAYKIASISIMLLIGPFQMAYEPFVFKQIGDIDLPEKISKITTYILLAFLFVSSFILLIFRDLIHLIAPPEYGKSYFIIFLILPGLGATALSYIGQSLLHIKNKTAVSGKIVIYSTLVCLLLSYYLIMNLGLTGLIISLNFYFITTSIIFFYFGNKEIKIPIEGKRVSIILVSGVLIYISLYNISYLSDIVYYLFAPTIIFIFILTLMHSNFFSLEEKNFFMKNFKSFTYKLILKHNDH
jgi:O-antigen/teichoic acid export membrane protein